MTTLPSSHGADPRQVTSRLPVVLGCLAFAAIAVAGLSWAKWLPYHEKVLGLAATRTWDGGPLFDSAGATPSMAGAVAFAQAYFTAVWRALLVGLLLAAAVDALLPRQALARTLSRGSSWRQAAAGGLLGLPSMMCTCCTAPVTASLRRAGVPVTASVAHWLANPVLNPAVLVFLALVGPWQWTVTRAAVGVALVVATAAVLGAWRREDPAVAVGPELVTSGLGSPGASAVVPDPPATLGAFSARYLRSLARMALVLVPEYLVLVMALGAFSGWLAEAFSTAPVGALGLLVVALVGTLLVVPTGGEIAVALALSAAGAGNLVVGVALVTLPAVSLPSAVMVARSLGVRVTAAVMGAVVLAGVVAGGLLTALA